MQGRREETHLEYLLGAILPAARGWLEAHPDSDPMVTTVNIILQREAPDRCPELDAVMQSDALTKAGRAYLALLCENDRLPPDQQLSSRELALPRHLLLSFFQGGPDVQRRAQEVLSLIEQKFAQRAFQQASILLQLFETDQSTRVQNERKLFYEDMIQRLGIRRREPLPRASAQRAQEHFAQARRAIDDAAPLTAASATDTLTGDSFAALRRALLWLAQEHQLRFCLLLQDQGALVRWREVAALGDPAGAAQLLRSVPPLRWRELDEREPSPLIQQLSLHVTAAALRDYVASLTRACYFILLAVGDTGLEGFIDTYFEWLRDHLDVDGTDFMDRLHRESTQGERTLQDTLELIYEEFFADPLAQPHFQFSQADLERAALALAEQLSKADLSEVAPGHFDLGGFVLDHLLGVQHPTPEFPFRVHRIG
jgi:hypothetical protein